MRWVVYQIASLAVLPALLLMLLPVPAWSQGPHGSAGTADTVDALARARRDMAAHMGGQTTTAVFVDRLEHSRHEGERTVLWDVDAWHGGDLHKLWLKTEGERLLHPGEFEHAEVQLLYSRAVSPFFDLQAGVRHDFEPGSRSYLVIGLQGLAPHWFEVDAALFLSDRGDVTARVEAEYDLLLTQRLILQPRLEIELAAQDVPRLGVGSGLGSADAGLRLRYEAHRSFAPYLGISWQQSFGATRDIHRRAGADTSTTLFVAGVRMWF
jgi:copper resistance protein B